MVYLIAYETEKEILMYGTKDNLRSLTKVELPLTNKDYALPDGLHHIRGGPTSTFNLIVGAKQLRMLF